MDLLMEWSQALSGRVAEAGPWLVSLTSDRRKSQRSGFVWAPGLVVTSEQGLPDGPAHVVLPGGETVEAAQVGRDPSTNVALYRLPTTVPAGEASGWPAAGDPAVGMLTLLLGADGNGGPAARIGLVSSLGGAWTSMAGGRIDRLIRLDARLSPQIEGGPVLDAAGGLLGMSTLGPRRRALVIPTSTITRVVSALVSSGRVARGWLGVSLHPVAVPPALNASATAGLMIMSIAPGGPGEQAGLLPGDIILTLDGSATEHPRATAATLASLPVGRTVPLRLLRGGVVQMMDAVIGERPSC
jgi:S1-C subfamily serine protease